MVGVGDAAANGGSAHTNGSAANGKALSQEVTQVTEMLSRLLSAEHQDDPHEFASSVLVAGVASLEQASLVSSIRSSGEDMGSPGAREGAMKAVKALAEVCGRPAEPYILPLLPLVLERMGDKVTPVREAAAAAGQAVAAALCPMALPLALPPVFECIANTRAWQAREAALKMLKQFAASAPAQVATALPDIVPSCSECLVDAREQVKKAAWVAMTAAFKLNGNRDIEPCVPDMLSCIARPAETPAAITKLSATTFVQAVEAPALAIMVPLLIRGLRHNETPIKRKTCIIIANMAKLVNNPADATVFLPRLLAPLKVLSEELADPECRSVAGASYDTLLRMDTEAQEVQRGEGVVKADKAQLRGWLAEVIAAEAPGSSASVPALVLDHVAALAACMIVARNYAAEDWKACVADYLETAGMPAAQAGAVSKAFRRRCEDASRSRDDIDNFDDGPGVELCNCEFSLAYGGKILLNNARLILKRGRRYGLCGANGAGKSTLMKAIAAGKVEGFPPPEQLRTVYVAHDIQAALEDQNPVGYIMADPLLAGTTKEDADKALTAVGFTEELKARLITALSGGWKMKLALARAMLLNADILLLDEPTNHLDRANVEWLQNYLLQEQITALVVSHDSAFLDIVCTDIYHYEQRRLKRYRGNLSEFVKVKPEARSYYELGAALLKFKFPDPAPLDGVTSREKSILKMSKVSFTYPGATKPQLTDISLHCRLASRVAVLGANGAGKSTLIKILTGELRPQTGTVTRHPNMRVAYVAQHAFHHLEEHLDTTPNRYILRRYSGGEDKEEAEKVHRKMDQDEWEKIKNQIWMIDGQERKLDKILGRRKKKRSYEYEIAWVGLSSLCFNRWITREELIERGFEKLVNEVDGKKAAEQKVGEITRPLTVASIEEFLRDFGLDPEFGTHSNIRGLSGGQKVKLVLAAAMWSNPHMLIMDEPTNYLDRDSLGALAQAIKDWSGGVIVISHHQEFIGALCSETWNVVAGKLSITQAKEGGEGKEEDDK